MVSYIEDGIYTEQEEEIMKKFILDSGKIKGITEGRSFIMRNYFDDNLLNKIITIFDETSIIPEMLLNPLNHMVSTLFKLKMPNMVTKELFSYYKRGIINKKNIKKMSLTSPTGVEVIRYLHDGKGWY